MNIWEQAFDDLRRPHLEEGEKKAAKDYDGDGKVETGSQEYLGSRDKAIKKAMGKCKDCGKDPCGCDTKKEEVEVEEGYKEIDKKKENKMYRRAGNLARTALSSKGKKKEDAMNKSGKIVSAIARQKENERFSKMGDEKARSNYKEENEIEEGMKQARKNVGASTCWDGYKAQGTKKKNGKEVPNCVKENEIEEGKGMHRDAKTGEVVDKAEVGKIYYPNMPKQKSSVALRKEKEKMKKEHSSWRNDLGFFTEVDDCSGGPIKPKKGVKNKITINPEIKTENVQGGPLLPGEGRKVYPKGAAPKKTGATLPLANSHEPEGEVIGEGNPAVGMKQIPSGAARSSYNMRWDPHMKMYVPNRASAKPTTQMAHFEPEGEVIEEKKGLYANIHAKRARGEAPAKPGDEGYPAKDAFKKAAKTAKEEVEFAGNYEGPLYAPHPDLVGEGAFKSQYGDKTKLSQSSQRKSLGRGSSIRDGAKKRGYESPSEFRDSEKKLSKYKESLELELDYYLDESCGSKHGKKKSKVAEMADKILERWDEPGERKYGKKYDRFRRPGAKEGRDYGGSRKEKPINRSALRPPSESK